MKIFIYPNLEKKNCKNYTIRACDYLLKNNTELFMDCKYKDDFNEITAIKYGETDSLIPLCDCILAAGGDGTILRCCGYAAKYNKPILGLNCGRLGFMATLEHSELELLDDFCKGSFLLDRRMMIDVVVTPLNGGEKRYTALNDIVLLKDTGCKIADFAVSKNNMLVSSLRADGLIFSTPTGATAYSLSAGGPIIEPEMNCIEFTQICAHSLFARSIVFAADSIIDVSFHTSKDSAVTLTVDGDDVLKLKAGDSVKILNSKSFIELIDIKGGSFFSSVNRKLMQPLKSIAKEE